MREPRHERCLRTAAPLQPLHERRHIVRRRRRAPDILPGASHHERLRPVPRKGGMHTRHGRPDVRIAHDREQVPILVALRVAAQGARARRQAPLLHVILHRRREASRRMCVGHRLFLRQ